MAKNIFLELSKIPPEIMAFEQYQRLPSDKKFSISYERIKAIHLSAMTNQDNERNVHDMAAKLFTMEELFRLNLYLELMEQELILMFPPVRTIELLFLKHSKPILAAIFIIVVGIATFLYLHKDFGLMGYYYSGTNFDSIFRRRQDKSISFNWAAGGPFVDFRNDYFSVRWKGFLKVDKPGKYEFKILSDDGARLFINDEKIIDTWWNHFWMESIATVDLSAGNIPIQIDYFDFNFSAGIFFYWRDSPDSVFKLVPSKNLLVEDFSGSSRK